MKVNKKTNLMTIEQLATEPRAFRFRVAIELELFPMDSPEESEFIRQDAHDQAVQLHKALHPDVEVL